MTETIERPTEQQREPWREVTHMFCPCQKKDGEWVPPMTALCGYVKTTPVNEVHPPGRLLHECIVCQGLHAVRARCPLCKRSDL